MLPEKTKKYIEAMILLGDRFDPIQWAKNQDLTRWHELPAIEERELTSDLPAIAGETTLVKQRHEGCFSQNGTSERTVSRAKRNAPAKASKIGLRQRLDRLVVACGDFKESRKRDAIYAYLRRVFGIVRGYRIKRRSSKLCQRAYQYAGLSPEMKPEPFAVVIRCTCDGALDAKAISRLSRALRYAEQVKPKRQPLKEFVKSNGGINGCAAMFAAGRRRKTK
jgi:hypothetical protein